MSKSINQGNDLRILYVVALNCMMLISAHAANPATKEYVDAQVNRINTEIAKIDSKLVAIPMGGTTGQVLAKASNSNYDSQWLDASVINGQYTIGQHIGTDVVFFVYEDENGIERALVAAGMDEPGGTWAHDWPTAKLLCASKADGGYTWFLPDKAQISTLRANNFAIHPNPLAVDTFYWSSTEVEGSPGFAWSQGFSTNSQYDDVDTTDLLTVRCIRSL